MKIIQVTIDATALDSLPKGRINTDRLNATTEADIAVQQHDDESAALQDAAKFARRVRRRLGLSQVEFSHRINVPIDTIRHHPQLGTRQTLSNRGSQDTAQGAGQSARGCARGTRLKEHSRIT